MKKLLLAALAGVVIMETVLLMQRDESFGAPAVALRHEVVVEPAHDALLPAPSAPRELELPATERVGRIEAPDVAAVDADALLTLMLDEAPPVPDLPALKVEPLEFTLFEPPYDARAIPQAVWHEALAASRARRAAIMKGQGVDGEIGRWLVDRPPEVMERYLARATLDVGLQAWVHMGAEPGFPQIQHGRLLLYDPRRGVLTPEVITLETRFNGWEPDALPAMLGQADLDLDGRRELVVREERYNGPGTAHSHAHWFGFGPDLRPRTLLRLNVDAYVGWHGWPPGAFETRVIPVSPTELWVEAWHRAAADDARVPIGHTVYGRAWPGATFAPRYQVNNPDTPSEHGRGYTTEAWQRDADTWNVRLALGTQAMHEVPAVLDAPVLEVEPLAFTFFEPPYDERAIPRAVLDDARAFCAEVIADLDADHWLLQQAPEKRERYLAVATLHDGLQAWVHMALSDVGTGPDLGRLLLFDTRRATLLPERLTLETQWSDAHPTGRLDMLGRADLDLDGVPELVVREIDHNGTMQHDVYLHWFPVDAARGLGAPFVTQRSARGWFEHSIEGLIHARLIPLSSTELRAEAWFEPNAEYDAPRVSLGYTLFARADAEGAWRARDEVHNPWAPTPQQQNFTRFEVSRRLGWRVRVERADAGR